MIRDARCERLLDGKTGTRCHEANPRQPMTWCWGCLYLNYLASFADREKVHQLEAECASLRRSIALYDWS